jgi:hypothetical protein
VLAASDATAGRIEISDVTVDEIVVDGVTQGDETTSVDATFTATAVGIDGEEASFDLRVVDEETGVVLGTVEGEAETEGTEFDVELQRTPDRALFRQPDAYDLEFVAVHHASGEETTEEVTVDVSLDADAGEVVALPERPTYEDTVTLDGSRLDTDSYDWFVYHEETEEVVVNEEGDTEVSFDPIRRENDGTDAFEFSVSDASSTVVADGQVVVFDDDTFDPELSVGTFRVPEEVTEGEAVTAEVDLLNDGRAVANYVVRWRVDGEIVEAAADEVWYRDADDEDAVEDTESASFSLSPGTHEITAVVIDSRGDRHEVSQTVTVSENDPPRATVDAPDSVVVGESITVDASGSTDPDGDSLRYEWDTDGDGEFERTGGATVEVQFDETGTQTVVVRVRDEAGASSTATAEVRVESRARTPPLSVPFTAEFTDGLDGWHVDQRFRTSDEFVAEWGRPAAGEGGYSDQYDGSVRLRVDGGPSTIGVARNVSGLTAGTEVTVSYHTSASSPQPGKVAVVVYAPDGDDEYESIVARNRGSVESGTHTITGTVSRDYPNGTEVRVVADVWPGEYTIHVDNVSTEQSPDAGGELTATRDLPSTAAPGERVTATVTLTADGAVGSLTLTEETDGLRIVTQSTSLPSDNATLAGEWSFSSVADQTVVVNYTVAVPESATDGTTYALSGTVTATDAASTTVAGDSTLRVRQCVVGAVAGEDDEIGLRELQRAVDSWASGEPVAGQQLTLRELQELVNAWAEGDTVDCDG